jgi:hypothetical protein
MSRDHSTAELDVVWSAPDEGAPARECEEAAGGPLWMTEGSWWINKHTIMAAGTVRLVLGGVLAVAGLLVGMLVSNETGRYRETADWPVVTAPVIASEVESRVGRRKGGRLTYQYTVEGTEYTGYLLVGDTYASSRPGTVTIRYNPAMPQVSRNHHIPDWAKVNAFGVLAVVCLLVGAGLAYWGVWAHRHALHSQPAGAPSRGPGHRRGHRGNRPGRRPGR